jgi:predicted O-linked N-acetylglucosamine transferase (SPINDLY family)
VNGDPSKNIARDTDLHRTAMSFYQTGRYRELLELLETQPVSGANDTFLLNMSGICFLKTGENEKAEQRFRRIIELNDENAEAYCNLGLVLRERGNLSGALMAYQKAISILPHFPEAQNNLGLLYADLGRFREAELAYRTAIAIHSTFDLAFFNLGNVLLAASSPGGGARECIQNAEMAFRKALESNPHFDKAYNALGSLLFSTGRYKESESMLLRAISIQPQFVDAHYNLGRLYHNQLYHGFDNFTKAEIAYRRVLDLDPNHARAHGEFGRLLRDFGSLDEGIAHMRRAVDCAPTNSRLHSNLIYSMMFQAEEGGAVLAECRRWAARHESPMHHQRLLHDNQRSVSRRLRIGYVSPDFRNHCQALFTIPLFRHHDHGEMEIFLYSCTDRPDEVTQQIAGYADVWRDVCSLSDAELAKQINEDRIDILVDLTMHMGDGRPLVFAFRPAPVQLTWLAYPGTTGLSAIGYRLTDPYLDPRGSDDQYSERSIRLPASFWCYDPLTHVPVNDLPALKNGRITFGSFNNPRKITDRTLQMWGSVLRAVDSSKLLLMTLDGKTPTRLLERMKNIRFPVERVTFVPFQPRDAYLQTYYEIDIGLDTFPYNGHTTSLDSFWMGVPVVTRAGNTAVGRGGFSLLSNLGMSELAAFTDEDFVRIALGLCSDLPRLSYLRQTLRSSMEKSPLMDAAGFALHMEAIYRQIWKGWCLNGDGLRSS